MLAPTNIWIKLHHEIVTEVKAQSLSVEFCNVVGLGTMNAKGVTENSPAVALASLGELGLPWVGAAHDMPCNAGREPGASPATADAERCSQHGLRPRAWLAAGALVRVGSRCAWDSPTFAPGANPGLPATRQGSSPATHGVSILQRLWRSGFGNRGGGYRISRTGSQTVWQRRDCMK